MRLTLAPCIDRNRHGSQSSRLMAQVIVGDIQWLVDRFTAPFQYLYYTATMIGSYVNDDDGNWKGFGRKRSWPTYKVPYRHSPGGTEENHGSPQSG
jgi:hypothetical protein